MKCVVCNGSDIQVKGIEEEIRLNNDILLVPMEGLVCSSCGERYYDRKNLKRIEEVRSRFKNNDIRLKTVGKVLVG